MVATISIQIKPYSIVKNYVQAGRITVSGGTTIKDLLDSFGISKNPPLVVRVNGRISSLEDILTEGDMVELIPPILGG